MSETTNITLAGKDYPVRPLTLRQVRDVFPVLSGLSGLNLKEADSINTLVNAVSTTLRRDHPELTEEVILDQEVTVAELTTALRVVGKLAGLKYKDEVPSAPGEAQAAAGVE